MPDQLLDPTAIEAILAAMQRYPFGTLAVIALAAIWAWRHRP